MYCLGYCTPLGYIIAMLWPKRLVLFENPIILEFKKRFLQTLFSILSLVSGPHFSNQNAVHDSLMSQQNP